MPCYALSLSIILRSWLRRSWFALDWPVSEVSGKAMNLEACFNTNMDVYNKNFSTDFVLFRPHCCTGFCPASSSTALDIAQAEQDPKDGDAIKRMKRYTMTQSKRAVNMTNGARKRRQQARAMKGPGCTACKADKRQWGRAADLDACGVLREPAGSPAGTAAGDRRQGSRASADAS